ncbi:IS66 family insertion sequence element accessory protein TnpA [Alteromonas sp. KUL42]|uniref:IS66 family insertion sequence element accessory protein TnpA n=1 Tax=Alteromonas sp. KUL42 TaxID=2480797 RepID=UPI00384D87B6
MRHPQRSQQEWRQLFKQQKQSGLSSVEFCRQQHINIQIKKPYHLMTRLFYQLILTLFSRFHLYLDVSNSIQNLHQN